MANEETLCWLDVLGFYVTLTAKVISWRSSQTYVSWLSHTSTNTTFFPKPPNIFLILCFSKRRKYAGKKVHLNWVSISQPQGHGSDTLTTEPPGQGKKTLCS